MSDCRTNFVNDSFESAFRNSLPGPVEVMALYKGWNNL